METMLVQWLPRRVASRHKEGKGDPLNRGERGREMLEGSRVIVFVEGFGERKKGGMTSNHLCDALGPHKAPREERPKLALEKKEGQKTDFQDPEKGRLTVKINRPVARELGTGKGTTTAGKTEGGSSCFIVPSLSSFG